MLRNNMPFKIYNVTSKICKIPTISKSINFINLYLKRLGLRGRKVS